MWKNFAKEYFSFTRKERMGIYTLLVIIFLCIMIPFFFPFFIPQKKIDHNEFDKAISDLKIREDTSTSIIKPGRNYTFSYNNNYPNSSKTYRPVQGELFYFDPNTISGSDWKRLGIRDKTIATIEKYISKGGHFYKAEDISKIWGLRAEEVSRLLPYVHINDKKYPESFSSNTHKEYQPYHKADQKPFDVNTADSATLDSLPGIGPRLAKRILSFRDKLGGFASVDQVKETFGLPDSTFFKIKPKLFIGNGELKKLSINTCSADQLKMHPYIRYAIANAIVQYRTQHGSFNAISDIKNIMIITDEIYDKISPYLTVK